MLAYRQSALHSAAIGEPRQPVRVAVVDDPRCLAELRPAWTRLLHASAANGPFLTWEWLHTWWTHLHGSAHLQLLAVHAAANDELIAIAPFLVTHSPLPPFSKVEFLGTGGAGSDYLDVIVRRGREREGAQAIARFLQSRNRALHLRHLPPASLASRVADELRENGWTASERTPAVCPFIRLAGHSWESYLSSLGSSHRANVRRRLKALNTHADVRFERATSETERRLFLTALAGFHAQRWDARGGSTTFQTPALRAFHEETTRLAMEQGWLRLFALRVDGEIAAVLYGLAYNDRFFFFQHGFDERYRQHSVGLVMMALAIRSAIDEGAAEFDMLYGDEPYKSLWAHDTRALNDIRLFPAHIAGTIHRYSVEAERAVRTLARRVLSAGVHAT
jgi:CelD/BcsL family acetyltransferase involved in cellulose biosynthesis